MSSVFNTSSASGVPAALSAEPTTTENCVSLARQPGRLSFQEGIELAGCVWSLCNTELERPTRSICDALKGVRRA